MQILHSEDWDPESLHAPNPELVPPKNTLGGNIPFAIGIQLIVDAPVDHRGVTKVYIDDTVSLTVNLPGSKNSTHIERALLTAITQ